MTAIRDAAQRLPLAADYLGTIEVDVGPVVSLGPAAYGERRVVDIRGGRVDGTGLRGIVVPGGADWQTARADGVVDIDAHYSLLLDDGARLEVVSNGMRYGPADVLERLANGDLVDPAEYFFRTFVRFQTGAPHLAHLNRTMVVAVGARYDGLVVLTLYGVR